MLEEPDKEDAPITQLESMYDMLPDPFNDRQIKDLPMPPNKPMRFDQLFINLKGCKLILILFFQENLNKIDQSKLKPNWKLLKQFLLLEGTIEKSQVLLICKLA